MHLSRRHALQLPLLAAAGAALPGIAHATASPQVRGAYNQIAADGRLLEAGFEGAEHALAAYTAIYDVTRDDRYRQTAEALLRYVLGRRPAYMGANIGKQLLQSPFLRKNAQLRDNLDTFAASVVDRLDADPDAVLRAGDIRTLAGRAELLVDYAGRLERGEADPARFDAAARVLLDRLVQLQFTRQEAAGRFGAERFTGAFPHLITGDDGSMGTWDISTWALAMLSLDQYESIRALAKGFGRFHDGAYNDAAAAGARQLLGTTAIDPALVYAGAPAGFPLDGAEYVIGDEGGEQPYLITYGWSPNAIAQLGSVLRAVRDNRVTVPRSSSWAEAYWTGTPRPEVLNPARFWEGLDAKIRYTHDFIEAVQLPVPAGFPWIDLERAAFPSTGGEDFRRGGWFDGSGRGTMSAVYSRLAVVGYVESGGRDAALLDRLGQWWDRLLVWDAAA
ncbi:hypothetical protein E1286_11035 [Nonomuraea terrae]|uniref:Tat pathway signal protein n=1 Tax=Nonomuraea terrae TaxID=2530383 RepID=A0A4R4Z0B0_9ACTN|nr:hypothetical protein [Nonomuraea terrae]TDD51233.1 hypothetical protein E1286_11035 [Nonomuraea terrae]